MNIFSAYLPPVFLLLMALLLALALLLTIKVRRITVSASANVTKDSGVSLATNDQNRVLGYLKVTHLFRRWGMFVGLVIGVITTEVGRGTAVLLSTNWLFSSITGYFLGSLVGAWKTGISSIGPRREASLAVRSRNDFVSEWLIKATYLTTCGAVGLFVASMFEPTGLATESVGVRSTVLAGAVMVAIATDVGTRRLAKAARPTVELHDIATLDAIARTSSSDVAVAGLSLSLWLLSLTAFSALPKTHEPVFVLLCFSVGIVALFAAAAVWFASRPRRQQQKLALPA